MSTKRSERKRLNGAHVCLEAKKWHFFLVRFERLSPSHVPVFFWSLYPHHFSVHFKIPLHLQVHVLISKRKLRQLVGLFIQVLQTLEEFNKKKYKEKEKNKDRFLPLLYSLSLVNFHFLFGGIIQVTTDRVHVFFNSNLHVLCIDTMYICPVEIHTFF